jgi:hypothetical protein
MVPAKGAAETPEVSIGGEVRLRYEYFRNAQWGQGPQDENGYWMQRYMLHANFRPTENLRALIELKSGLVDDRVGGPRSTDEDRLDWHQMLVELNSGALNLRAGRQELAFGSSRLISVRESPNVRLAFDGLRVTYKSEAWQLDAIAAEPVETNPGSFDDHTDRGKKLWGFYVVTAPPMLAGGHMDVYYLGLRRDRGVFNQGAAGEERHSLGARIWGRARSWDYNWELVAQFGKFGGDSIAAWTIATDTGFTLSAFPLQPRLGLKANVSSGDRDPKDGRLQTFNALFPRGAYFSEMGLLGPANLTDLHPGITLRASASVTLTANWDFFWRTSTADGLYGPALNLVRASRPGTASYAGSSPDVGIAWKASQRWTFNAQAAVFLAGPFLRETGRAADVVYTSTWVTYLF